MMKRETFTIANIYVPVKRRATYDPKKAEQIAESILQVGLQSPILVRQDGERFVLVEGLPRSEACKQLGEETIAGYLVQVRRHYRLFVWGHSFRDTKLRHPRVHLFVRKFCEWDGLHRNSGLPELRIIKRRKSGKPDLRCQ